ncbi:uncharacterized protein TNCV_4818291 [Trichonephila clavipes]|nr:uncharacterized protein TNCV_4818291 [Trichonephila clavipes]
MSGVLSIFQRSETSRKACYTQYLGDGNSKGFLTIKEAKVYGDTEVEKLECVGHVQKRMGTRLRNILKMSKGIKLSDGENISGRGRLTLKEVDSIQHYYGLAIRKNLSSVEDMKRAIWAIYFHKLSTEDNPQHALCPLACPGSLKITEKRLVEKEIECASLTENILIVNALTESNDHPKTLMSTKEREINPNKRKAKKSKSSGRNANKTSYSDENQALAKEKNDLLRQIDFLNSNILDTKLKEPKRTVKPHDRYEVEMVGQHEGLHLTSIAVDFMKRWSTPDA